MGSSHDTQRGCLGDTRSGQYLMYPSISNVRKFNNNKLSTCSQRSVRDVIARIFEGKKSSVLRSHSY